MRFQSIVDICAEIGLLKPPPIESVYCAGTLWDAVTIAAIRARKIRTNLAGFISVTLLPFIRSEYRQTEVDLHAQLSSICRNALKSKLFLNWRITSEFTGLVRSTRKYTVMTLIAVRDDVGLNHCPSTVTSGRPPSVSVTNTFPLRLTGNRTIA